MTCNDFQQRLEEAIASRGPTANEIAAFARHLERCEDPACAQRWTDHERLAAAASRWRRDVPTVDLVDQVLGTLRESSDTAADRSRLTLRPTYALVREPATSPTVRPRTDSNSGSRWIALSSTAAALLLMLFLLRVSQPTSTDTAAIDAPSPAADSVLADSPDGRVPQRPSSPLGQTYASMPLSATEFVTDAVVLVVPADLSDPDEEPTRADVWADRLGQRLEPIGRELSSALETLMHAVPHSST